MKWLRVSLPLTALISALPTMAWAAPYASCGGVAHAPFGAMVGSDAPLRGTHQYTIHNTGNQTISVTVLAILEDSEGGRTSVNRTVQVPPKGKVQDTITTFFRHSFRRPGGVRLTATTVLSGGASATYRATSSFYVAP